MTWINDRTPAESDSDSNGCVIVQRFPNTDEGTVLHWSLVKTGLKWKHAPNWHKPALPSPVALRCLSGNIKQCKFASIEDYAMTWINYRLPTKEDSDRDGDVCLHLKDRGDCLKDPHVHWSDVTPGQAWRRSDYWLPPKESDK